MGSTQRNVKLMVVPAFLALGLVTVSFVGASGASLSTSTMFATVPISATLLAPSRANTPYDQVPAAIAPSVQPVVAGAHTAAPASGAAGGVAPAMRRTTYPATPESASPAAGQAS